MVRDAGIAGRDLIPLGARGLRSFELAASPPGSNALGYPMKAAANQHWIEMSHTCCTRMSRIVMNVVLSFFCSWEKDRELLGGN